MKKILAVLLVCSVILCSCGCRALQEAYRADMGLTVAVAAESEPVDTDNSNEKYCNTTLGFSAIIPQGWNIATDEEIAQFYSQVQTVFTQAGIQLADENILLLCSQYHNSNYNPTIIIETCAYFEMDINAQVEILQRTHEVAYASRGIKSAEVSVTPSCVINDADYILFSIASQFDTYTLYQNQYYIASGEYWLVFSLTYFTSAQKEVMDCFMQNVEYMSIT